MRSNTDKIGLVNPILLSLLVEAIEKKTLYAILKDVLQELGMNRTFMGSTDVPTKDKTSSYHVSSKRTAQPQELENLTRDTIENCYFRWLYLCSRSRTLFQFIYIDKI